MGTAESGGGVFYVLSNLHLRLTDWLPAYAKSREVPWPPNFVWLGLFALFFALYVLRRKESANRAFPRHAHAVFALAGGIVFFFAFVLNPRTVLYNPERTVVAPDNPLTFYSMSRVVRKPEPGHFLLPDDGRSYVFAFSSVRKLVRLRLEFGSETADCQVKVEYFDAPVFDGRAVKEMRFLELAAPPAYPYRGGWLYFVTLRLGTSEGGVTAATPYGFRLMPEAAI
jgi:hypothetical protein